MKLSKKEKIKFILFQYAFMLVLLVLYVPKLLKQKITKTLGKT